MRKVSWATVAGGLILTMAIAAGTMATVASAASPAYGGAFAWRDGAEVYAKICAYCHEHNVGPVIRGRSLPAVYIRTIVRNGRWAMPAFRAAEIDDESLTKLADYIEAN